MNLIKVTIEKKSQEIIKILLSLMH